MAPQPNVCSNTLTRRHCLHVCAPTPCVKHPGQGSTQKRTHHSLCAHMFLLSTNHALKPTMHPPYTRHHHKYPSTDGTTRRDAADHYANAPATCCATSGSLWSKGCRITFATLWSGGLIARAVHTCKGQYAAWQHIACSYQ